MGRRAKKAPVQTKKRPTLAKRFKCPFCANDAVVECKMDFRAGIGSLSCRLCAASYQMPIHHLHEPVDVFSEWLDDCEAAAQGRPTGSAAANANESQSNNIRYDDDDDSDDDNNVIPEHSGLKSKKSSNNSGSPTSKNKGGDDKSNNENSKATYSALGLDDSDDDSDDD